MNWFWVLGYTAGLTQGQQRDRRDEVRSDMHEEQAYATSSGVGVWTQERQVFSRMFRGVVGDLIWRWEAGRQAELVARNGVTPPLPWFSSVFLGSIIALGAVSSTQVAWLGDFHVVLAMLAMIGASGAWLGLHLATHKHCGPMLVAAGTACVAWSLWWTLVIPVFAVAVAISGVRRAHRIESLVNG